MNRNEDGTYTWKFDNYMRVFYPQRYDAGETRELWGRISCPTLLIHGSESWAGNPSDGWARRSVPGRTALQHRRRRSLGAPRPTEVFLSELRRFLAD